MSELSAPSNLIILGASTRSAPPNIASMIAWRLNPQNNWLTAQVFRLNDGLSSLKAPR